MKKNLKNEIIFLLKSTNANQLIQSSPNSSGHIYLKSCFNILQTINKEKAMYFMDELSSLLKRSNVPHFNYQIIQLIYERWLVYPQIIESLCFLSKKLKNNKLEVEKWERIIYKSKYFKEGNKSLNGKMFIISQLKNLHLKTEKDMCFLDAIMDIELPEKFFKLSPRNFEKAILERYEILLFSSKNIFEDETIKEVQQNETLVKIVNKHFSNPICFQNTNNEFTAFIKLLFEIMRYDFILNYNEDKLIRIYEIYKHKPELFSEQWIDLQAPKSIDILSTILDKFIISVFFKNNFFKLSGQEKEWFYDFIKGKPFGSLKNLPFKPTKKAVHLFRTSIEDYGLNVRDGIILCQLLVDGTNLKFALEFINNLRNYSRVNFWLKLIPYFSQNKLKRTKLGEVMDYIDDKTFNENIKVDWLKKKMNNLIKESDQWHDEVRLKQSLKFIGKTKLPVSKIEPFKITLDEKSKFLVKQVTSYKELYIEGYKLNHCVYSYRHSCMSKHCEIYSLRHLINKNYEPLITIEVRENKIHQMKGNFNRNPKNEELELIFEWMKENKLEPSTFYEKIFNNYFMKVA